MLSVDQRHMPDDYAICQSDHKQSLPVFACSIERNVHGDDEAAKAANGVGIAAAELLRHY